MVQNYALDWLGNVVWLLLPFDVHELCSALPTRSFWADTIIRRIEGVEYFAGVGRYWVVFLRKWWPFSLDYGFVGASFSSCKRWGPVWCVHFNLLTPSMYIALGRTLSLWISVAGIRIDWLVVAFGGRYCLRGLSSLFACGLDALRFLNRFAFKFVSRRRWR